MNTPNTSGQTIIIHEKKDSNGIGIAGFVLSLIAFVTSCFPILNGIIWFLGLLFSFIGVFNKPRGLAIAGLIISLIGIIFILIFGVAILGLTSLGFASEGI